MGNLVCFAEICCIISPMNIQQEAGQICCTARCFFVAGTIAQHGSREFPQTGMLRAVGKNARNVLLPCRRRRPSIFEKAASSEHTFLVIQL